MSAILRHIPVSHYNEKARWALDCKGIDYELRAPMPGLHRFAAMRLTRGKHDRLPVMELDGKRVGDSTAIIAALEELRPDPPLYPADPGERKQALELEDYFDEELAPRIRRFLWHHTLDDVDATVEASIPEAGRVQRRVFRAMAPVVKPLVKRDYGISGPEAAEALEGIRSVMDRIERELGSGDYLVGDAFSVADLTGAALSTPLLAPPGRRWAPKRLAAPAQAVREELEARPAGEWVREMYSCHRERAPVAA